MGKSPPTAADFDFLDKQISKLREDLNQLWKPFDKLKDDFWAFKTQAGNDVKALENVSDLLAKKVIKLEATVQALLKHAAAKK